MITTALGDIEVYVNGYQVNYDAKELPTTDGRAFAVDKRYKVTPIIAADTPLANASCVNTVECKLRASGDFESGSDSGQYLELISIISGSLKLCIGVESEVPRETNDEYTYLDYGLRVTTPDDLQAKKIVFGVAWLEMKDKYMEGLYPIFAADPTWKDFRSN